MKLTLEYIVAMLLHECRQLLCTRTNKHSYKQQTCSNTLTITGIHRRHEAEAGAAAPAEAGDAAPEDADTTAGGGPRVEACADGGV